MLVWQKGNLGENLIIIKVQIGPVEKNVKFHNSAVMNIMGSTFIM